MKEYEVVDVVRQVVIRERRYKVSAISEQDAIRRVIEHEAADGYFGERQRLETSEHVCYRVDGENLQFNKEEATAVDGDGTETGGGD